MVDSAALKTSFASVKPYSNIDGMLLRAAIAALLLTVAACGGGGGSEEPPPPGLQPTLASIQANVFTPSCAKSGCHTGAGAQAGLHLDPGLSWNNLVGIVSSQNSSFTRVIPMNPDDSLLIQKLEGKGPNNTPLAVGGRMPADAPPLPFLQQSTVDVIRLWIANGAQQ